MNLSGKDNKPNDRSRAERPCSKEILDTAFSGWFLGEQHIERILDHLEQST